MKYARGFMEKRDSVNVLLNKLWIFVAVVSILLVVMGIVVSLFGDGVYLGPLETYEVSVEVTDNSLGVRSTVNFILAGVVVALFLVTVTLLILLFMRKHEKRKIPKFNVFGVKQGK
jgi:ABC-type Fe3+ transport system permease subunit